MIEIDKQTAERLLSEGVTVYAWHEMDEVPFEVTSTYGYNSFLIKQ